MVTFKTFQIYKASLSNSWLSHVIKQTKYQIGIGWCSYITKYLSILIKTYCTESFRLSYYPHRLDEFQSMLKQIFGETCKHTVFGDFKPMEEIQNPAFYIHLVEKAVWDWVRSEYWAYTSDVNLYSHQSPSYAMSTHC